MAGHRPARRPRAALRRVVPRDQRAALLGRRAGAPGRGVRQPGRLAARARARRPLASPAARTCGRGCASAVGDAASPTRAGAAGPARAAPRPGSRCASVEPVERRRRWSTSSPPGGACTWPTGADAPRYWPNEHPTWPLHRAVVDALDDELLAAAGFGDLAGPSTGPRDVLARASTWSSVRGCAAERQPCDRDSYGVTVGAHEALHAADVRRQPARGRRPGRPRSRRRGSTPSGWPRPTASTPPR